MPSASVRTVPALSRSLQSSLPGYPAQTRRQEPRGQQPPWVPQHRTWHHGGSDESTPPTQPKEDMLIAT